MKSGPGTAAASAAPPPKARKGLLYWTLVTVGGFAALVAVGVLTINLLIHYWMAEKDLTWQDATDNKEKVFSHATPLQGNDGRNQAPLLFQKGELKSKVGDKAEEALNRLLPDWVPVYPGTTPQNTGATLTGTQHTLYFEFRTPDRPKQILEFYKAALTKHGLSILEDRLDIHQAFLKAAADDGRSVVLEAPHEGATTLAIDDPSFEGEARH